MIVLKKFVSKSLLLLLISVLTLNSTNVYAYLSREDESKYEGFRQVNPESSSWGCLAVSHNNFELFHVDLGRDNLKYISKGYTIGYDGDASAYIDIYQFTDRDYWDPENEETVRVLDELMPTPKVPIQMTYKSADGKFAIGKTNFFDIISAGGYDMTPSDYFIEWAVNTGRIPQNYTAGEFLDLIGEYELFEGESSLDIHVYCHNGGSPVWTLDDSRPLDNKTIRKLKRDFDKSLQSSISLR